MPAGMVTGLRGVDLGVPDVAAHARFYTGVWRLSVAAEHNGAVYLRGTGGYHHILSLHPYDKPALLCVNLAATSRADVDRLHLRVRDAAAFWVKALGFEVSDRSLLTFIRCNSDHHNIAFHPGESSTLHHIAFEMADIDSVMRGAGRMRDAGHPIEWGLGRHGPGNNVFAYFVGLDDFVIEYTAEIEKVAAGYRVREPGPTRRATATSGGPPPRPASG